MLVMQRRKGEKVVFDANGQIFDVIVTEVGSKVKLAVNAPLNVRIYRGEQCEQCKKCRNDRGCDKNRREVARYLNNTHSNENYVNYFDRDDRYDQCDYDNAEYIDDVYDY